MAVVRLPLFPSPLLENCYCKQRHVSPKKFWTYPSITIHLDLKDLQRLFWKFLCSKTTMSNQVRGVRQRKMNVTPSFIVSTNCKKGKIGLCTSAGIGKIGRTTTIGNCISIPLLFEVDIYDFSIEICLFSFIFFIHNKIFSCVVPPYASRPK